MQNSSVPGRPKRAFLAFEGGGAKGIVHVGALRALEGHDLHIAGVAGTSAGAIVAALVAAGYKSRELVAEDGTSPLLELVGLNRATEFFGPSWKYLAWLRWGCSNLCIVAYLLLLLWVSSAWLASLCIGTNWSESFLIGLVVVLLSIAGVAGLLTRGIASLDVFVDKLELAIATKLGLQMGQPVFFRDLDAIGRPLRVIATDVDARRLTVFSSATTPTIRVAEAVAASAALPIACSSRLVDKKRYIDGGIVSNLPAWTFDEERALDPDAVTIAISIESDLSVGDPDDRSTLQLVSSILLSAMFGRRNLEMRAAPRLLSLSLRTDVQTIDFDLTAEEARTAVNNAEIAAKVRIAERLFELPQQFSDACEIVRDKFDQRVTRAQDERWRTRVLVALRDPGATASWRIQFGCGLAEDDADDQILLPEASSVLGHAAIIGRPILEGMPFNPEVALAGPENRYRKALIRRDLAWCYAIPVLPDGADDDDEPLAILSVDSDLDVNRFNFDEAALETLAKEAVLLTMPVVKASIEV